MSVDVIGKWFLKSAERHNVCVKATVFVVLGCMRSDEKRLCEYIMA